MTRSLLQERLLITTITFEAVDTALGARRHRVTLSIALVRNVRQRGSHRIVGTSSTAGMDTTRAAECVRNESDRKQSQRERDQDEPQVAAHELRAGTSSIITLSKSGLCHGLQYFC